MFPSLLNLTKEFRDDWLICRRALRDNNSDVVILLVRTEALDLVDGRGENFAGGKAGVLPERGNKTLFAELFFGLVRGLGDTVSVEGEDVAAEEAALDSG